MTFFDQFFKDPQKYPKEQKGNVYLENDLLVIAGEDAMFTGKVMVNELQYIYFIRDKNQSASIHFFDHHQHYLPLTFNGFTTAFNTLGQRLGFNDDVLKEEIYSRRPLKKLIWRKKFSKNYQVITDLSADPVSGYVLTRNQNQLVSWDLPIMDVFNMPEVHVGRSPYGHQILKFPKIQIGNIRLNNFEAYATPGRPDAPVLHFYVHCYNELNDAGSYEEIKKAFQSVFPNDAQEKIYERDDQACYNFYADDMEISLIYTFDSEWHFDGGYTLITIKNNRRYPELLVDPEYEQQIEISEYLIIDELITTSDDYKSNDRIREKFKLLNNNSSKKPMIWRDLKNDRLGFADRGFYQIFKYDEISHFEISNMLPAKGGGGGYLDLKLNNEHHYTIFSGQCYIMDKYKDAIEKLTGKKVEFAPEYYDC